MSASEAASAAAPAGQRLWEPGVWGDLALFESEPAPADAAEGEESDGDCGEDPLAGRREEVILSQHPSGLEICPTSPAGRGAIVTQCGGVAAALGMQPGTAILAINERPIEDVPTDEIRSCLQEEPLPFALHVQPMLNLQRARKMKTRSKDPVTVCTAHCRGSYRAVQAALAQLGWKEVSAENRETSVIWLEHSDTTDGIAPVQTVSRLDAFLHMCRKAQMARCLNSWIEELPDEFTFVPTTWILPYDAADLEAAMTEGKKATYIAKPSAGTQGKGIILARKWSDLKEVVQKAVGLKDGGMLGGSQGGVEYVVQRYIAKPLLLNDMKWDMRIYAVVTSVVPLRAYLFKEGLARFCTVPYQAPKDANIKDNFMHLTNFAVNKQSKDYVATEGSGDEGSKRSVSSVFWEIEQIHGVSVGEIWAKIAALTANTLMALRPGLLEQYVQQDMKKNKALHPFAPKGFQIIGLDVLLDSKLEPQLIELNANPSLSVLQPGRAVPAAPSAPSPTIAASSAPSISLSSNPPDGVGTPLSESAEVPAAGSALQAVRSVARSPSPRVEENSSAPDLGASAGSASDDVIFRITAKLSRLSEQDLLAVEAFVDSLASPQANQSQPSKPSGERSGRAAPPSLPELSRTTGERFGSKGRCENAVSTPSSMPDSGRAQSAQGRFLSHSQDDMACTERPSASERSRRSLSTQCKQRLGLAKPSTQEKPKESKMVTSQLDLEIKRELIAQTLLLAKPAPQGKVSRLRKQWISDDTDCRDTIPIDDDGAWVRADLPADSRHEVRPDAPDRCPCLEALDFEDLVIPEISEYSRAHFALFRTWIRSCAGQSSVGQAQMMKLLERRNFVGAGLLFAERVAAQLWLTKVWRAAADGAFGLDLPQFVRIASWLGTMLRTKAGAEPPEGGPESEKLPKVGGVLEFVRSGGATID